MANITIVESAPDVLASPLCARLKKHEALDKPPVSPERKRLANQRRELKRLNAQARFNSLALKLQSTAAESYRTLFYAEQHRRSFVDSFGSVLLIGKQRVC